MTPVNRLINGFSELRMLLNASGRPEAGITGLLITKKEAIAHICVGGVCLSIALALMWGNDRAFFWHLLAALSIMVATMIPGAVIGWQVDTRSKELLSAAHFFGLSAVSAAIGIPLGHLVLWVLSNVNPIGSEPFPLTNLPEFLTLFSLVTGYWRLVYIRQWEFRVSTEKLKREAAEHGQALAEAQLKMLQAQIEPHFLFNTLASVQHLVRKDPLLADFLLTELTRYLRQAMPDFRGMGSTLGREFGLNEAFLNIARIRMGNRLTVKVSIPDSLTTISFPPLVIQTLVENSIKHGVEPKIGPVNISIVAKEVMVATEHFVEISVIDDGVGFGQAATSGTGVGLKNIRERLKGLYGDKAQLEIFSVNPTGVCVVVRVPSFIANPGIGKNVHQ